MRSTGHSVTNSFGLCHADAKFGRLLSVSPGPKIVDLMQFAIGMDPFADHGVVASTVSTATKRQREKRGMMRSGHRLVI